MGEKVQETADSVKMGGVTGGPHPSNITAVSLRCALTTGWIVARTVFLKLNLLEAAQADKLFGG